jgi:acetyl esterase/lipase
VKEIKDLTPLVDPQLATAFAAIPMPAGLVDVPTRRAYGRQFAQAYRAALPPSTILTYTDHLIPATAGHPVPVRIFAPREPRLDAVLLWMHGGGFSSGHHEDEDLLARPWVEAIGCTVVSVGYRMAPEFQAPCALEDCYTALEWIATAPRELPVKPARIAVGGISAGGCLAAGVALKARDQHGPRLCFQLLLVPCADNRSATPSMRTLNDPRQWSLRANLNAWQIYAGGDGDVPPYTAPARAADLSALPPAYVEIAGVDPLRDEGIEYATRMMQAGVSVELHVFPGALHASTYLLPQAQVSVDAREEATRALQRALQR